MSALRSRRTAPALIAVLAVAAGFVVRGDLGVEPLGAIAALLLCLLLPGAALVAMVPRALHPLERVALAVGLSLACVVGISAGFAAFGVALEAGNWSLGLMAISVAAAVVAVVRGAAPGGSAGSESPAAAAGRSRRRAALSFALGSLAAILVAVAGLITARSESDRTAAEPFTELWAAHPEGSDSEFAVGVRNAEGEEQNYEIELTVGDKSIGQRTSLSLADGESELISEDFPASASVSEPVVAELYLGEGDEPYREVELAPRD